MLGQNDDRFVMLLRVHEFAAEIVQMAWFVRMFVSCHPKERQVQSGFATRPARMTKLKFAIRIDRWTDSSQRLMDRVPVTEPVTGVRERPTPPDAVHHEP